MAMLLSADDGRAVPSGTSAPRPFHQLFGLRGFSNCWRCGAVTGDDAWWRGCDGVGEGYGNLPSLADTIAAVRRELSAAQATGQGQPVQFRTGPVELEFEVGVTRTGGGQAGVQLWVLTLGGKAELGQATTQRIKVTLQPVNPETGEDARIADTDREPAEPPP
jgi:hypothetical protein